MIDTIVLSLDKVRYELSKRSRVILQVKYFNVDEKEMLTLLLVAKILDVLENEDKLKLNTIEVAKDESMDGNR